MMITVGLSGVSRELQLSVDMSEEELAQAVNASTAEGTPLNLRDKKNRQVIIPAAHLAYVMTSEERTHQVGFTAGN